MPNTRSQAKAAPRKRARSNDNSVQPKAPKAQKTRDVQDDDESFLGSDDSPESSDDSDDSDDEMDVDADDADDSDEESVLPEIDSGSDFEDKRRIRQNTKLSDIQYDAELVNGFNALRGQELKKIAMDQPARLARTARKTKKLIKKNYPAPNSEELRRWTSKDTEYYDRGWTREMEDDLQKRAKKDAQIKYIKKLEPNLKSISAFMAMWKKICRVLKVFPTDIISPFENLEYGAGADVYLKDKKGRQIGKAFPDPIWSKRFCDELVVLAIGGPWMGNMRLLACVIKYAKACQVDDRRRMSWQHSTTCRFMDSLQSKLESTNGTKSIPKLHKEVRRKMVAKGLCLPAYSSLLRQVEKQFYKAEPDTIAVGLYRVKTGDLHDLVKVVRSVMSGPHQLWPSLRDASKVISTSRGSAEYPDEFEHVMDIYMKSLVSYWRSQEVNELSWPTPADNVSGGGLAGRPRSAPGRGSSLDRQFSDHHPGDDSVDGDVDMAAGSHEGGFDFSGDDFADDSPEPDPASKEYGQDDANLDNRPLIDEPAPPRPAAGNNASGLAPADSGHVADREGIVNENVPFCSRTSRLRNFRPLSGSMDMNFKLGSRRSRFYPGPPGGLEMHPDFPESRQHFLGGMDEEEAKTELILDGKSALVDMAFR